MFMYGENKNLIQKVSVGSSMGLLCYVAGKKEWGLGWGSPKP